MRRLLRSTRFRLLAAVAVLLLAGGWWVVAAVGGEDGRRWGRVERDDLVLDVQVEGTLHAKDSSSLGPPQLAEYWEFKISLLAPEGQFVEEGTPVLGFDDNDLRQRLQQKMAEAEEAAKKIDQTRKNLQMQEQRDTLRLAEAEARLRRARLKVEVPGELAEAQELQVARLDLELAQSEFDYLEGRLESSKRAAAAQLAALEDQRARAENRVEEIREAIGQMVRPAPRDGTVIYATTRWNDEKKKVGDSCWRNDMVVELPNLETMEADGRVDEADAGRLSEGQPVRLRLDAHPDVEFAGHIESIWRSVQRKSWRNSQKVVRLTIALDETDTRRMRPGMRFRGRIEAGRVEQALLVPLAAVVPTADGPYVLRRTWVGDERVAVRLGERDARRVQVLDGLAPGDEVLLTDGDAEADRS